MIKLVYEEQLDAYILEEDVKEFYLDDEIADIQLYQVDIDEKRKLCLYFDLLKRLQVENLTEEERNETVELLDVLEKELKKWCDYD